MHPPSPIIEFNRHYCLCLSPYICPFYLYFAFSLLVAKRRFWACFLPRYGRGGVFYMCQVSVTLFVIAFVIVDDVFAFVISFVFLMPLSLFLFLHTLSKRGCRKYNRTNTLKSCLPLVQVHSAIALMTILAMVAHLMMTLWHYGTT